jgi:predicted dinucleotide-binding enzyme
MNITIVGSGNVGRALGEGWRKSGHSVTFAAREPTGTKAAELKKAGFTVATMADAATDAEVIVLATPWDATAAAIKALGALGSKIVVDATNPLTASLELALGFSDSAGETVARLSGARVVKAFNTTGANNMANAKYPGGKLMMPVAGDDADAKKAVMALAAELGFEPIDFGPLAMSRHLEPMAMAWIKLAYAQGMGREFGFAVLRR